MSLIGSAAGALTGNIGLYLAGGLLAAGVTAFGVQTWRLHDSQTEAATERAAFATREAELQRIAREAEARERAKEQQWAKRSQEITDETTRRLAAADAAASAADAASGQLRDRVSALAARGRRECGNPALARGGAPAGDPIGLLAELHGRTDEAAGIYASEADRRRIRALACEAEYEKLRNKSPAAPGTRSEP